MSALSCFGEKSSLVEERPPVYKPFFVEQLDTDNLYRIVQNNFPDL